jgi:hypothetical protein
MIPELLFVFVLEEIACTYKFFGLYFSKVADAFLDFLT